MSTIEERIAEVLRDHMPTADALTEPGGSLLYICDCQPSLTTEYKTDAEWCAHVASVLVAELGLREVQTTGKLVGGTLHIVYDGSASKHRYYMTPWEPA